MDGDGDQQTFTRARAHAHIVSARRQRHPRTRTRTHKERTQGLHQNYGIMHNPKHQYACRRAYTMYKRGIRTRANQTRP